MVSVASGRVASPVRLGERAKDIVCAAGLGLVGLALAFCLNNLWRGQLPEQDAYFGADLDRVIQNLATPGSDYYRACVHPMMPLADAIFRGVAGALSLSPDAKLKFLAAFNGLAFGVGVYSAARGLGAQRTLALAATCLGFSSAAFVYWAAVPETHFVAGLMLLAAATMLAAPAQSARDQAARRIIAFTLAYSMVVTNVVMWLLAQIRLDNLKPRLFLRDNLEGAFEPVVALAAGFGLQAMLIAVERSLTNASVPPVFFFFAELDNAGLARGDLFSPVQALGLMGSNRPLAGELIGAVGLAAVVWSFFRLPRRLWFLPLFLLFGVALHSVYDSGEVAIFGPNYLPTLLCVLAVAASTLRVSRLAAAAIAVGAIVLLPLNLSGYRSAIADISDRSWPAEVVWRMPTERVALVNQHFIDDFRSGSRPAPSHAAKAR